MASVAPNQSHLGPSPPALCPGSPVRAGQFSSRARTQLKWGPDDGQGWGKLQDKPGRASKSCGCTWGPDTCFTG